MSSDEELEDFKTNIDLRQFAAEMGFALDRNHSGRASAVMKAGNGDKIIIKRGMDGHYTYFSVHDDRDNGSIIDFVQHRRPGLTLGSVRKELRSWVGRAPSPLPSLPTLEKTGRDRMAVETRYRAMQEEPAHPYLIEERCIPASLLASERFAGQVRIDERRNAIFPHFDQNGLCGYEIKNLNFTGFPAGGEKGLWFSRTFKSDLCLVIAESAIDAISYAALFPDQTTRYASIGGQINPQQPELIKAAVQRMPEGALVISATDNDKVGHELGAMIGRAVQDTGRSDLRFRLHCPDEPGLDWNQVLKDRSRSFPTARLKSPSLP